MKKKYCVRLWYTWYDDIEVEAESREEAEDKAMSLPWKQIEEDFHLCDLQYDTNEIFEDEE